MSKKYFFFDIDGTLTDRRTNQVVPSAQLALKLLQEAGHFVSIATGRAHYKAKPFMESIGLENMVCSGGAGIVVEGELLENTPLDLEKSKALLHEAESLGYGTLVMVDDSEKVYGKDNRFREQVGERTEPTTYVIDSAFNIDELSAIYKFFISISPEKEDKLTLKNTLSHLRFEPDYLMFQYDQKDRGIEKMMAHLGASLKDMVVFGDDVNDLVMFKDEWLTIAMGNASDELKKKASYITAANIDDGIYKACKHFGWLNDSVAEV